MKYEIQFQPSGVRIIADENQSILQAAQGVGIHLSAVCGGAGHCGKCRVELVRGRAVGPDGENVPDGTMCLACHTTPASDLIVRVPASTLEAGQRLQVDCEALQMEPFDSGWALESDRMNTGIAVDMGSTKIAAYIVDLDRGEVLAAAPCANQQMVYGEDVISRIAFCNVGEENAGDVRDALRNSVNEAIEQVWNLCDAPMESVRAVVLAGNTVMHHMISGLPVKPLGEAPYHPVQRHALMKRASDLELHVANDVPVYLPPNIAGYIGGDHVAALVSASLLDSEQTVMLCDIGTNTEISLLHKGTIHSCSCASGPAFEGAHITQGMKAVRGAICHVSIHNDSLSVSTVDDSESCGICGSGMLDAVAELLRAGALLPSGRLDRGHPLVSDGPDGALVRLDERVGVTQKDISVLQLAKGAIRAGIEVLLKQAGLEPEQIEQFYLAGAFGTYLDVDSAVGAGLVCDFARGRIRQIGNASGLGAVMLLLSEQWRVGLEEKVRRIEHVSLTDVEDFNQILARAMLFPSVR